MKLDRSPSHKRLDQMRTILCIFLFCLAFGSTAQDQRDNSIDIWLNKAIQKDQSTVGMRAATNKAREMWDKEMNQTYMRLIAHLTKEQQASLREAQRAWLKYRDAEGKVITDVTASKDGTMWQLIATDKGMELVRMRALQLKAYEDALAE